MTRISLLTIITLAVVGGIKVGNLGGADRDGPLYSVALWPGHRAPPPGPVAMDGPQPQSQPPAPTQPPADGLRPMDTSPGDDGPQSDDSTSSGNPGAASQLHAIGQNPIALEQAPSPGDRSPPPPPLPSSGSRSQSGVEPESIPRGSAAGRMPAGSEVIEPGWKPIGAVSASIALPAGDLPADLAVSQFAAAGEIHPPVCNWRDWEPTPFNWEATAFYHGPVYFEQINLERYGYTCGIWQPAVSAVHFFGTIPLLPYEIVSRPPWEKVYTLGYYRPGDAAPRQREKIRLRPDAAMAETAVILGLIIAMP